MSIMDYAPDHEPKTAPGEKIRAMSVEPSLLTWAGLIQGVAEYRPATLETRGVELPRTFK